MDNKLGTRASIPPKSRMYIIARALEPPRINRRILARKLQKELKEMGFDMPEAEVLERIISKARNYSISPLDRLWSLANLDINPLPVEVLPMVMSFQQTGTFTIRGAIWAARLYKLIPPDLVFDWVWLYTIKETVAEMHGKPFNSVALDVEMTSNPHYAREERRAILIFRIAEEYDADPIKLKALNLPIKETEETVKANPEKFITKEKFYLTSTYKKEGEDLIKKMHELSPKETSKSKSP